MTGDFTAVARVASVSNTNSWAKAGLMLRETLAANARHDSIFITPGQGVSNQWRSSTGGTSSSKTVGGIAAPYWIKLVRSGSTITASYSAGGAIWTLLGSRSLALPDAVYVGLAVTSHNTGATCTATFDHVSIA
jgi:regulation of enolase protein 1 (concanavalin A-like superfamily)